jgi:hypothetical protein
MTDLQEVWLRWALGQRLLDHELRPLIEALARADAAEESALARLQEKATWS